jgi:hypothetical protein
MGKGLEAEVPHLDPGLLQPLVLAHIPVASLVVSVFRNTINHSRLTSPTTVTPISLTTITPSMSMKCSANTLGLCTLGSPELIHLALHTF